MLKILYAGCLDLSPAISLQFSVEMCAASKNWEKFTKNPFLGDSTSLKVINVYKSKKPVASDVMISSMYVPICNSFHTIQANNGKITSNSKLADPFYFCSIHGNKSQLNCHKNGQTMD